MQVTATQARNRLGQVLAASQDAPVTIRKDGRRHSVVLSAEQYDRLLGLAAAQTTSDELPSSPGSEPSRAFYEKYKDWVDLQNEMFAQYGIPGEEFRTW